jgi:hypothetical protein
MTTQEKTIVLGDEYDERLRAAVLGVLEQLGVSAALHEHGLGGSQELETLTVEIGDKRLVVEAETYVGLSVRGDAALVEKVESMVRERLGSA